MATATDTTAREEDTTPGPAVVVRAVRSRRRPVLASAGIALVLVGGLGTYWLTTTQTHTVAVIQTSSEITRGQSIPADKLTTLTITGGQSTNAIPASKAASLAGKTALVDLPRGTVLTTANVGRQIAVPAGSSIVGLALTASQMPSHTLVAGDPIRVVETPTQQGDPPTGTPDTFPGTVSTTSYDQAKNVWRVDIIVKSDQAPAVAARAATGRLALILDTAKDGQ